MANQRSLPGGLALRIAITIAILAGAATSALAQAGHPPPFDDRIGLPSRPAGAQHGAQASSGWQDDFTGSTLDLSRWIVMNGQAPGAIADNHIGYFQPDRVSLSNSYLVLLLTQENGQVGTNPNGVISRGGGIHTTQTYGYGTYQWRMRMSSTAGSPLDAGNAVSGSVSAGFIYVNNSQTEIDFEFSGQSPDTLWLVNWLNPTPALDPTSSEESYTAVAPFDSTSGFHTYRFVWAPGIITYYIDGVQESVHTTNVPSAPAYFMINHWGTDSTAWGGPATIGTTRTFYIDHVSFTPPQ